jgi:hypothetical protein
MEIQTGVSPRNLHIFVDRDHAWVWSATGRDQKSKTSSRVFASLFSNGFCSETSNSHKPSLQVVIKNLWIQSRTPKTRCFTPHRMLKIATRRRRYAMSATVPQIEQHAKGNHFGGRLNLFVE